MELEPISRWSEWRNAHINYLREVEDISGPKQYINTFAERSVSKQDEQLLQENEIDLTAFERVYPFSDQDIAMVLINPGLTWNNPSIDDHNIRIGKANPDDFETRIKVSMEGVAGWLGSDTDRTIVTENILPKIAEMTPYLSEEAAVPENINAFFSNVYYTNWYKFATNGDSDIPKKVKNDVTTSFVSHILRLELSKLNPELVLVFGQLPWRALRKYSTPPQNKYPDSHKIRDVHGFIYNSKVFDSEFKVIPFVFPADHLDKPDDHNTRLVESIEQLHDV